MQRTVASREFGVVAAIGEIQLPVDVFHVLNQVLSRLLEVRDRDVGADARDHDALIDLRNGLQVRSATDWTSDAREASASARPQRLPIVKLQTGKPRVLRRTGIVREVRLEEPSTTGPGSRAGVECLIEHIVLHGSLRSVGENLR